jgi:putative Holliday junction resolvase
MPIIDLKDLESTLGGKKRLLAIDHGTKTLGLAQSDENWIVATPIKTINRTKFTKDIKVLEQMIREDNIGAIILGLPLNMDGSEGPRCQSVRQFADNLIKQKDVLGSEPVICFWDERLSTSAVERFLIDEVDMNRKRRGEVVDKLAALHILQGAIDRLSRL